MIIRKANNEGPDQTAPSGAVWSGSTLFAFGLRFFLKTNRLCEILEYFYG